MFKGVKNRKRSGFVDCQQVGLIDRNLTTVDEVNCDKTKVPEEVIFRSVLLDCFAAELDD